jgi:DNA-binding MarR family transcriptional regulator
MTTDDADRYAELERALTRLIRRAFLPTAGEATRREAGVHLERAAYVTLVRVTELDGGRLSDIAAALGVEVSTASRHVKRLVEEGYVEATTDPDDARARRYRPTPAGDAALCRVRQTRRSHLAEMLDDWPPDDVDRLAEGLDRLVDTFEAVERGSSQAEGSVDHGSAEGGGA